MLTEPHKIGISSRIYKFGERGSGCKPHGLVVQDFYRLRDECIAQKKLFIDPDFEANDTAVFGSKTPSFPIVWKRPPEICSPDMPRMTDDEASRFDVVQGKPGNCWMVSALANLTLLKPLFKRVVPQDQSFDDNYAGIFHFRFWKFGKWIDVVIDDRLPTENDQLCFIHSSQRHEFWSSLVEKAYAKLRGSYDVLVNVNLTEIMVDFTGGLIEFYKSDSIPHNFYNILFEAWERSSLIVAATHPVIISEGNKTPESLVLGHAYSITKLIEVNVFGESQKLLRICNPWGNYEGKGPLCDRSLQWAFLSPELRLDVNLTFENDREVWMSYEDFIKYFSIIEVCNLAPDSITSSSNKLNNNVKTWQASGFEGKWVQGVTAGGCRNHLETFASNPQYTLEVMDTDDGKETSQKKCSVIIALMQKSRGIHGGQDNMKSIGFALYMLTNSQKLHKPLNKKFFHNNNSVGSSPNFVNTREVVCRFFVPPGTYCIVPSTFYPNEEAEFIIRVFTAKKHDMKENDSIVGNEESFSQHMIMVRNLYGTEEKTDKMELFNEFCDEHGELNDAQLGKLLHEAMCYEKMCSMIFDKHICCNMISMVNSNLSRTIKKEEFRFLWDNIQHWEMVYKSHVKDHGHYLNAFHLRDALFLAGFMVNNHVLNILVQNYSNEKRELSFENFLMCAIRLQVLINEIEEKDHQGVGKLYFCADELAEKMASL